MNRDKTIIHIAVLTQVWLKRHNATKIQSIDRQNYPIRKITLHSVLHYFKTPIKEKNMDTCLMYFVKQHGYMFGEQRTPSPYVDSLDKTIKNTSKKVFHPSKYRQKTSKCTTMSTSKKTCSFQFIKNVPCILKKVHWELHPKLHSPITELHSEKTDVLNSVQNPAFPIKK